MLFSVATNWQEELLDRLDKSKIIEIYAKLNSDCIGGGRASAAIPAITRKRAASYVRKVHSHGMRFNYLLNSTCLDNAEWSHRGQRDIRGLLDWLAGIEVDAVTVSSPYLLEIIKKCYPAFEVNVSTQAGVDSPVRAKFWEDLGADQITLSFVDVNRDFPLLREIRKSVRCRLQLIANLMCLYRCPFYKYHANINAHASQNTHKTRHFLIDYCFLRCNYLKFSRPWQMISAGWIRPEDLSYYAELGIERIKLVDRAMQTEDILRVVRAYTGGKYDGNLLDLFPFPRRNVTVSAGNLWHRFKYFMHPAKANIFKLYEGRAIFEKNQIYLDNKKLDGFPQFFLEGKCKFNNCDRCGYCHGIADRAMRIPEEYRNRMLKQFGKFLDRLVTGEMFSYKI
jgi:collagenase-like PrtC family protease